MKQNFLIVNQKHCKAIKHDIIHDENFFYLLFFVCLYIQYF